MMNKDSELKVRISKYDKDLFLVNCQKYNNKSSQVIRELIKIYNHNNFIRNEIDKNIKN